MTAEVEPISLPTRMRVLVIDDGAHRTQMIRDELVLATAPRL